MKNKEENLVNTSMSEIEGFVNVYRDVLFRIRSIRDKYLYLVFVLLFIECLLLFLSKYTNEHWISSVNLILLVIIIYFARLYKGFNNKFEITEKKLIVFESSLKDFKKRRKNNQLELYNDINDKISEIKTDLAETILRNSKIPANYLVNTLTKNGVSHIIDSNPQIRNYVNVKLKLKEFFKNIFKRDSKKLDKTKNVGNRGRRNTVTSKNDRSGKNEEYGYSITNGNIGSNANNDVFDNARNNNKISNNPAILENNPQIISNNPTIININNPSQIDVSNSPVVEPKINSIGSIVTTTPIPVLGIQNNGNIIDDIKKIALKNEHNIIQTNQTVQEKESLSELAKSIGELINTDDKGLDGKEKDELMNVDLFSNKESIEIINKLDNEIDSFYNDIKFKKDIKDEVIIDNEKETDIRLENENTQEIKQGQVKESPLARKLRERKGNESDQQQEKALENANQAFKNAYESDNLSALQGRGNWVEKSKNQLNISQNHGKSLQMGGN